MTSGTGDVTPTTTVSIFRAERCSDHRGHLGGRVLYRSFLEIRWSLVGVRPGKAVRSRGC